MLLHLFNGIKTVGYGRDFIPLVLQKNDLRLQTLDLIINP